MTEPNPYASGAKQVEQEKDLPTANKLSLAEIFAVANRGLGLRNTKPQQMEHQRQEGLTGDYITISDLSGLLTLKPGKRLELATQYAIDQGQAAVMLFKNGNFDEIDNVDELPQRFDEALRAFVVDSFNFYSGSLQPEMHCQDYFEKVLEDTTPAFQIIDDSNKTVGRDKDSYRNFGKAGRQPISPKRILKDEKMTKEDFDLLRRKYSKYASVPIGIVVQEGGINSKIGDLIGSDLRKIAYNKILEDIRLLIR